MQQDIRFSLRFEGQVIVVRYRQRYISMGYDHFEFMSPHAPARPIPISQTGYRSHFALTEEVEAASDCVAYAYHLMLALMEQSNPSDIGQYNLF